MSVPRFLRHPLCTIAFATVAILLYSTMVFASVSPVQPSDLHGVDFNSRHAPALSVNDTTLYYPYQVDVTAGISSWTRPVYPDSLKKAKIEGEVLITFVVGVDGRVEAGSVSVLRASHPAFGRAVTSTLSSARFVPATVRGARVRQVWMQTFQFSVAR